MVYLLISVSIDCHFSLYIQTVARLAQCVACHAINVFHVQGGHFSGIYRKVQLKPLKWVKGPRSDGEGEEERPVEALMVLKYGGVLTHAGRKQVLIMNVS